MDNNGLIYTPKACQAKSASNEKCHLHVALHGCGMGMNSRYGQPNGKIYGHTFAIDTGYIQYADLNNVIILMPQVAQSMPYNDFGCWDYRGYTDQNFDNNKGL